MSFTFTSYVAGPWADAANAFGNPTVALLSVAMSARAMHAHLLNIAAARRTRARERGATERLLDAEFWKRAAPKPVFRASTLRLSGAFGRLP